MLHDNSIIFRVNRIAARCVLEIHFIEATIANREQADRFKRNVTRIACVQRNVVADNVQLPISRQVPSRPVPLPIEERHGVLTQTGSGFVRVVVGDR